MHIYLKVKITFEYHLSFLIQRYRFSVYAHHSLLPDDAHTSTLFPSKAGVLSGVFLRFEEQNITCRHIYIHAHALTETVASVYPR